jgi:hypothetical protein
MCLSLAHKGASAGREFDKPPCPGPAQRRMKTKFQVHKIRRYGVAG